MAAPAARRPREKHVVATLAEMPPGSRKLVTIGRREIAVHTHAHGASGCPPLKASVDEDPVQPLGLGLQLDRR